MGERVSTQGPVGASLCPFPSSHRCPQGPFLLLLSPAPELKGHLPVVSSPCGLQDSEKKATDLMEGMWHCAWRSPASVWHVLFISLAS